MSLPEKNTFADAEMAFKLLSVEPQLTQWQTELALAETARQTRDNTLSRFERGDATEEEVDAAKERVFMAWSKQKATRTAMTERLRSHGLLEFFPGLVSPLSLRMLIYRRIPQLGLESQRCCPRMTLRLGHHPQVQLDLLNEHISDQYHFCIYGLAKCTLVCVQGVHIVAVCTCSAVERPQ